MQDPRIPVIVVSGFLGSGKTTLLRKVLATPALANSMLIVNEIGEIGIDHKLFERSDDETVLLDNGCMCCQLRGDLQALLVDLSMRRYRGEIPSFDRVFIETSGLAEPGPVAQTLYGDGPLARDYRLAHVVTLIDPVNAGARAAAPAIAEAQVVAADLAVITKSDVANDAQMQTAREWISSLNAYARIIAAVQGDLDIALLADASPFELPVFRGKGGMFSVSEGSASGSYLGRHRPLHPVNVRNFALTLDAGPLNRQVFDLFMNTLLRLRGADLLRIKGIVRFEGSNAPQLIQGVCHVFDQPVPLHGEVDASGDSVLVFIARNLTREQVEAYWQALRGIVAQDVPV